MRTWIALDVSFLAYRAYYTTGSLAHENVPTGILYGFLRDLKALEERFGSRHFCFCFDQGRSLRKDIFPSYKENRRANTDDPDIIHLKGMIRCQISQLKDVWLPELGCKNVFAQDRYEADDVIASLAANIGGREQLVLVSADHDLFQLLGPGVVMYNPKEKDVFTEEGFKHHWGIEPRDWASVKAIAGCSSDNVPGCHGVGEITAAKFVAGRLRDGRQKNLIMDFLQTDQFLTNMKLVKLPYQGVRKFKPECEPPITEDAWAEVCHKNGIRTLPFDTDPFKNVQPKRRVGV